VTFPLVTGLALATRLNPAGGRNVLSDRGAFDGASVEPVVGTRPDAEDESCPPLEDVQAHRNTAALAHPKINPLRDKCHLAHPQARPPCGDAT